LLFVQLMEPVGEVLDIKLAERRVLHLGNDHIRVARRRRNWALCLDTSRIIIRGPSIAGVGTVTGRMGLLRTKGSNRPLLQ
jgi:hypothetical protein